MKLDGQAPVRALMTSAVVSLSPSHRVWEAQELFASCGLHHLPVIDEHRRLLGMVCHTDLYRAGVDAELPAGAPPLEGAQRVPIARVMRRDPVTIGPDATVERAVTLFAAGTFHALPVVDADERLVGILTTTDVLRRLLGR